MSQSSKTGIAPSYLHGYTKEEQDRLYWQARLLAPSIYENIDYTKTHQLLEVGSGVGAQTEILLERFAHLKITCLDASKEQVARAQERLKNQIKAGQVTVTQGDALHLPFDENSFDGAFICWLLEHVQEPVEILKQINRVLRPDGVIYCNEVLNATFYLHPYSPATLKYWFEFNDYQWSIKGDPFVGAKLANYLLKAGFQKVRTRLMQEFYDNRTPKKRAQFVEYWTSLLLSGAPGLIAAGKVTPELVDEMKKELSKIKTDPDAVFFYTWVQAEARAL